MALCCDSRVVRRLGLDGFALWRVGMGIVYGFAVGGVAFPVVETGPHLTDDCLDMPGRQPTIRCRIHSTLPGFLLLLGSIERRQGTHLGFRRWFVANWQHSGDPGCLHRAVGVAATHPLPLATISLKRRMGLTVERGVTNLQ